MQYTVRSYIGSREEQQDHAKVITDERGLLAVLCDGMGGRSYGAHVSKAAVEEYCFEYRHKAFSSFSDFALKTSTELDKRIYKGFGGKSGTTLVSVFIDNNDNISWFSLGDSRAYLFRADHIVQLTEDSKEIEIFQGL